MSVTLRLEGLSSAATSYDIREYFSGLEIPVGGVTVIGGKRGEAFVNFITWEDARRAIEKSGRPLKDSTVYVSLSSKDEMQHTLENNKTFPRASLPDNNGTHRDTDRDMRDSFSVRTHIYLRITLNASEATKQDIKRYFYNLDIRNVLFIEYQQSTTVSDVLVKFGNRADATEGINRYRDSKLVNVTWSSESEWIRYGGCVDYDDKHSSSTSRPEMKTHLSRSPRRRSRTPRRRSPSPRRRSRSPQRRSRSPRRRSRSLRRRSRSLRRRSRSPRRRSRSLRRRSRSSGRYSRSPRRRSRSSGRHSMRRRSRSSGRQSIRRRSRSSGRQSIRRRSRSSGRRSRSPRKRSRSPQRRSHSPGRRSLSSERQSRSGSLPSESDEDDVCTGEFHIRVTNLSYSIGKSDLKKLFSNFVSDDNITFLYDAKGERTRECFVTFTNHEHFKKVLQLNNLVFNRRPLHISPVSTSKLRRYFTVRKAIYSYDYSKGKCLHSINFPSDVSKSDVQKFFTDVSLSEEDIFLLCDNKGNGTGEVLTRFPNDKELFRAEKLNRKKYKDKEIVMKYISRDKLKGFLCKTYAVATPAVSDACVTQEDDECETQEDGASEEKCDSQAAENPDVRTPVNYGVLYECVTQEDEDDAANDTTPEDTEDTPGDAEDTPEFGEVTPKDAELSPGDGEVTPDDAEITQQDKCIGLESNAANDECLLDPLNTNDTLIQTDVIDEAV